MALDGLRVLSFESRRATEIATLIEKQGGIPFVAPSVRELPPTDNTAALAFADRIELGDFDLMVFMTGVGLRLFLASIESQWPAVRLANALKRLTICARGPKPVAVLRELGVPVQIPIPEPNTWREIIAALGKRDERKVGMLEHGRANPNLVAALEGFGMTVATYSPYHWEFPEDRRPLREAVRRLVAGECDVAVFTSSVQLEHLLETARESNQEDGVKRALAGQVCVASIGPTMTEALEQEDLKPDIIPPHPKMGALLHAVGALAPAIVQAKRLL